MGIGDQIMATGLARGAAERGKRVALGDGKTIRWNAHSEMIFRNNPNIAPPGSERAKNIEWVNFYKGHRIYNSAGANRWVWNYSFKVKPGEFFFGQTEDIYEPDDKLILLEPNVPNKPCWPNKQWPVERWQQLADELMRAGWKVRQFEYGFPTRVAPMASTIGGFRQAAALLKSARLAILPEGGLHHAAAAVGTPAIVLFGGFVPPAVLGYDSHTNLTGGATACGTFSRCQHCVDAMNNITVEDVLTAAQKYLA